MAEIRTSSRLWIAIAAAILIVAGLVLARSYRLHDKSDKAPSAASKKPPALVSVTAAQTRDLPVKFTAQGHLVPLNQVDVRPQIAGIIRGVHFHEGDQVQAGQLLFTLDSTDAVAQLNRVEAQAAQIKAELDNARRDYNRSKELVKSNFISSGAVDTNLSKVESLQAQLTAAQAQIDSAKVQLGYTRIVAPISGQAGALEVHPGSLAQLSAVMPLISLVQFDPIGVEFSLPEQNLNALLAARAANDVRVSLETPDGKRIDGTLSFINNTVNTGTGTINVKASFPNKSRSLWPGAFVRVTVNAGSSKGAIVLPPQAILEGPKGHFVYVVDANDKVVEKPVVLLRIQDEMGVVEGLKTGERVVLEGNQNLRPGATVAIAATSPVADRLNDDTVGTKPRDQAADKPEARDGAKPGAKGEAKGEAKVESKGGR